MQQMLDYESFARQFSLPNNLDYLKQHISRLGTTQQLAYQRWKWPSAKILDIGAHWLHQSVLFALDGHSVIGADLSKPLAANSVKETAKNHGVQLLIYDDLSNESVFDSVPENSIDVVLFCEILEHITFNPVGMWKAIHRVLKGGGRIILTTPSFYNFNAIRGHFLRYFTGQGGGISVQEILNKPTYSPHWKEFSISEIRSYFELLSSDFQINRIKKFSYFIDPTKLNWKGIVMNKVRKLKPFSQEGIYAEIDLVSKVSGISIEPRWGSPQ
jgi:2-polyprenyl-6-hydroxyphenyl methylase/3-demethylubiquinone-9 3-methyltransferase